MTRTDTAPPAPIGAGAAPSAADARRTEGTAEFDRQLALLLELGYGAASGLGDDAFAALLAPLRPRTAAIAGAVEPGAAPFLLVPARSTVPIAVRMELLRLPRAPRARTEPRPGRIDRNYEEGALDRFTSTAEADVPDAPAYLVTGVERGEEFCGAVPSAAMDEVRARGRTPLTIEEGIALAALVPGALAKNKCFSLGGTRSGDRRVPALWISERAPKLGWCWEGNPHTWLGMASAAGRTAA